MDTGIPIVPNRSGEILAQGVSGAASNIADTITQLSQRMRQTKAFRQMAVDGLGMDEEQVDRMSLPQLQGMMQGVALKSEQAQRQAQIQEMMARSSMWGAQAEESDAFSQMAPAVQKWAKENPGKSPTATDVLGMMSGAKIAPRAQGIIMNRLIQQMMNGENGQAPNFTRDPVTGQVVATSPRGGMMNLGPPEAPGTEGQTQSILDQSGNVLGQGTIDRKTGRITMIQKAEPTKPPPGEYNSRVGTLADNFTDAQEQATAFAQNPAAYTTAHPKANPATALSKAKAALQNHLDSYRQQGYGTPDFWQAEYGRYGLTPPAGTPAASRDAGTPAGVTPAMAGGAATGRIPVWDKTGKQFTIPAGQKADALNQGYLLAAPSQ